MLETASKSLLQQSGRILRAARPTSRSTRRLCTSTTRSREAIDHAGSHVNVEELLSKPTWSVSSLLPPKDAPEDSPAISSKQLHHLLRLSALPPPKDELEEAQMLKTLSSQLHFVKQIQKVDTTGVEPFRSLRDETAAGKQESELGMAAMKDALAMEEVRGKHHKRIKRKRNSSGEHGEKWDVLGAAERKVGRYFVVEGGKDG